MLPTPRLAASVFAICSLTPLAGAEVRLPALFADGMVLQREVPTPIWGTASPSEEIRVTLAGATATATTDATGRFTATLPAHKAGGPHDLRVTGKDALTVRDVHFGEVWLCSGQSNMQMPLSGATDGQREIGKLSKLELRVFFVAERPSEKRETDVDGRWVQVRADDAAELSAVAYFFAKELHGALDVPIGLIQAAVGGTPAEPWTDIEALRSDPALAPSLARAARQPKAKAGALFGGMIAPLAPYALKGVLWYQGESNIALVDQYRLLFPTLIKSWRKAWGRDDLPFLYVQLPGFGPLSEHQADSSWAALREVQADVLALPHTGMAVAIDVGDVDLHPPRKREVGERLARLARARVYGEKDVVADGPTFADLSVENGVATVRFDHVDGGLRAAKGEPVTGFAIAAEDGRFVRADARLDGDRVLVRSADVAKPVAVRYAWADHPRCNLFNGSGLPAAPFRTDREK